MIAYTPSTDSLLMSGVPEQRVLIALSMPDVEHGLLEELLAADLNWPWIIMQAMHHRTISLQWDTLKRLDLVAQASRSGLPKNWIAYSEQLSRASDKRNRLWLERLEWVFHALEAACIEAVAIKGSALIGDIYQLEQRMLGDVDTLVAQKDRNATRDVLFGLGFMHGVIDPVSQCIKPLSREKQVFWSLHAHIMPKFTLPLDNPDCPFMRLAVGFDFFDPGDEESYPSEGVIKRRQRKAPTSQIHIPDAVDTLINLGAHIFREGTSATIGYVGENWNLWKFCDFRSKLAQDTSATLRSTLKHRLVEAKLEKAFWYALHYTGRVYGDAEIAAWQELCDPGDDLAFLDEIKDGNRVARYERSFSERLFQTGRTKLPGLTPVWAQVMKDGEWW